MPYSCGPPDYLKNYTLQELADHNVPWGSTRRTWRRKFSDSRYLGIVEKLIGDFPAGPSRQQLFDMASSSGCDPVAFFIAVMVWGRPSPRGKSAAEATRAMVEAGESQIRSAFAAIRKGHFTGVDLYDEFNPLAAGQWAIDGLGPAFATKFTYFAGYDRARNLKPLILDSRVHSSLRRDKCWVWDEGEWDATGYELYLRLAEAWTSGEKWSADDVHLVEFALFMEDKKHRKGERRDWQKWRESELEKLRG